MSKLSHSNQATMDELERQRAIENGDEDLLGSPCLFTATRTPVDVAWEALERSETTIKRLIEAVGPNSAFHQPLLDALHGLKDYAFDALYELRMEKVEPEDDQPRIIPKDGYVCS